MKCSAVPLSAIALKCLNLCFKINVWKVYATCPILSKFGFEMLQLLICHISLRTCIHSYIYIDLLSSQRLVKTLVADTPLTAVDFMPDGATLAIGSSRGKIYQYDLRMLKSPVKTISAHKTSVQCIVFQYSTALSKVRDFLSEFFVLLNKSRI